MSFFGGGTDYFEYFSRFGGSVISTTIDKYCYVSIRRFPPFFEYRNQFTYSKIERFNNPDELQHPLVKAALKYIPVDGVQITYDADLPACSGIGSSSAFAVGLLQGLHGLNNEYPDKMALARQAVYLERDLCSEAGGVQDQLAAAFGGFNRINFSRDGYEVVPLAVSQEKLNELENNLLLMFTGFTHFSAKVAKAQQNNIDSTLAQLHEMKAMTDEAERIIVNGNIDDFGHLLNKTWGLKRTLSDRITTDAIDNIYSKALSCGALGGKLLGAGGGGFMLLYVPKEKQESFIREFSEFKFIPFKFETTGTKIIYENQLI